MERIEISNEIITLEPKYLNSDIIENIENELKKKKIGNCMKKYGIIKKITLDKSKILQHNPEISIIDGCVKFSVSYTIHSFFPKKGNFYMSKRIFVINQMNITGAVATIEEISKENLFQIYLTNGSVKNDKFIFQDCNCKLKAGVQNEVALNIIVDSVEYYERKFRVTGKHVH
ncbi:134L [Cherax quadricarinatus iridovirus]|uniref:Uncharacterized protein n=1 Tax=Shrimp hemocyte iridescent virus TaxID=2039780 RepID=A0A291B0L8_9VIRU|nr:134L [Cherax quadricarinatus iridovirus]YP_010084774.1 hypothetical protein KM509_gp022 [Shrimp hemocyte iridescent virus]UPA43281.1 hypothetical protein 4TH000007 [Iridovirus CN01]ASZ85114.1 134L [Cherax quadricarinatus iridovirus]ATE87031.1 hypothetical protein [Shrimp hemocyte iridescent virus]UPA43516.1 hypothetical protein 3TG000083 [Iridovirus CN01]UPA43713.1 hypothetical protein 1DG000121 [Iridovirus CN01]